VVLSKAGSCGPRPIMLVMGLLLSTTSTPL
jgi:hypothetical protein